MRNIFSKKPFVNRKYKSCDLLFGAKPHGHHQAIIRRAPVGRPAYRRRHFFSCAAPLPCRSFRRKPESRIMTHHSLCVICIFLKQTVKTTQP